MLKVGSKKAEPNHAVLFNTSTGMQRTSFTNMLLTKACYMTKPNSSGAGRYAQPTVESRGEWNSY